MLDTSCSTLSYRVVLISTFIFVNLVIVVLWIPYAPQTVYTVRSIIEQVVPTRGSSGVLTMHLLWFAMLVGLGSSAIPLMRKGQS